jgi:hypothetical protein
MLVGYPTEIQTEHLHEYQTNLLPDYQIIIL